METQAHPVRALAASFAQTWMAALHGITSLGINDQQSDSEQRQINAINTAYLAIILPIWLLLSTSYWIASRWPAAFVMTTGFIALSSLLILHSQGKLSLRKYGQISLPLVFLIPIAVALCLGGHLRSGLVTNWSLATPLLAILLDQPRTARRWFALLVAINVAMLLLPGEFSQPIMAPAIWIKSWQIFNRIGMLTAIYICLNYLHQQQQQAIQQLDTFAATVSHELRTPLTSVTLGLAHGLRQADRLDDSQQLALQTARQEARRCQVILSDLLALSRGDPEQQSQSLHRFDPYPLLLQLSEQLEHRFAIAISLTSQLSKDQRWVLADPLRFRQIIENLIENSYKYSDRSQPVEVTIGAAKGNQQLLIQVADRGANLSAQDCLAMFKPFIRLANANGKPGNGLGLTVVRRLVNAMGGSISATGRQGGGLCVGFTLVQSPGPESRQAPDSEIPAAIERPAPPAKP